MKEKVTRIARMVAAVIIILLLAFCFYRAGYQEGLWQGKQEAFQNFNRKTPMPSPADCRIVNCNFLKTAKKLDNSTVWFNIQDKITVTESEPQPLHDCVFMLSSMGHGWSRPVGEELWKLQWVAFDAKSYYADNLTIDKVIVEICGQSENISTNLSLPPQSRTTYRVNVDGIEDILSGEYDLTVRLMSQNKELVSRTDKARVFWKEKE